MPKELLNFIGVLQQGSVFANILNSLDLLQMQFVYPGWLIWLYPNWKIMGVKAKQHMMLGIMLPSI